MADIIDGLITDRTQADVERARALNALWDPRTGRWTGTAEEWAQWEAGPRGAYGFRDMNRVSEAAAYLLGRLLPMGYQVDLEHVTPLYSIQAAADPAQGGTASGGGVFAQGGTATVTAAPSAKYDFAGWMENGALVCGDPVYTFAVERSRALTAVFALKRFQVDASVEPKGSGQAEGGGVYDIDTQVTVSAAAGEGYAFTRWSENGRQVWDGPEYTFTLDRDRVLRAVMTKTHVISLATDGSGGGAVEGGGVFLDGQTVTASARAGEGFQFAGWQENGRVVSGDPVYQFPASADRALTALFVRVYTVTLLVKPDGWGTVGGGGVCREGAQAAVTAAPADGYRFAAWMEDGARVSTDPAYAFPVTGDRVLTAVFEEIPVYTVSVAIDPEGGGTAAGAGQYREGQRVTVRAVPAAGYLFSKWRANGQDAGANAEYAFTAEEDVELVAVFEVKPPRLPAGYAEVQYVQTVSNAGIPIGTTVNFATDRIVMDMQAQSHESGYELIFSGGIRGSYYCFLYRLSATELRYYFGMNSGITVKLTLPASRFILDIDMKEKKLKAGGKSVTLQEKTGSSNAVVFFWDSASPTGSVIKGAKLYAAQLYKNGVLYGDYVPCVRSSDGAVGLYDIVNGVFRNSTPAGGITAGPAV